MSLWLFCVLFRVPVLYGLVPVVVVAVDLGSGGGGGLGFAGFLVGVRGCVVFASSLLFWFAVGFA